MISYWEYCSLSRELHHAALLYFHKNESFISDEEYDRKYQVLLKAERDNPDWIVPYSPSQRVGSFIATTLEKVQHRHFMGSLENIFESSQYKAWIENCLESLNVGQLDIIVEPKIDGLALALHYENGVLIDASTRGDGMTGERVFEQAKTIKCIPLVLKDLDFNGEIRGEVYFKTQDFIKLNNQQAKNSSKLFSNARNAAAGSLRQQDPKITASRPLSFLPYSLYSDSLQLESQSKTLEWLSQQGFDSNPEVSVSSTVEGAIEKYKSILTRRAEVSFHIDGIVFKIDRFAYQMALGSTSRSPKWAVAWKCPSDETETILNAVDYQVGRFGTITPVAVLAPVQIQGVTIQSATLHNWSEIERKGLQIGQKVRIRRAGEVIPEVLGPCEEQLGLETFTIEKPACCPCCNGPVTQEENEESLSCTANYGCLDQQVQRIAYAVSQDALNTPGLSAQSIRKAILAGIVTTPSDLFSVTEQQWQSLEGIGPKMAETFCKKLKASLTTTPSRFLLSLNIRHIGKTTADHIMARLSWDHLLNSSQQDLQAIDNIGPITALGLFSFKESEFFKKEYAAFLDCGLVLAQIASLTQSQTQRLQGLHIVVTGTFDFFSRTQWENWLESHGAKAESSVSKKTFIVIAGQSAGSKRQKAIEKGLPLIEYMDALAFVQSIDSGDQEALLCLNRYRPAIE